MKKIVLLALLLLSGVTASAQYYDYEDSYYDSSYDYVVGSNIDLTGEQWHLAGTSILAAANNLYLIIDGTNRFVRSLHHFDRGYYERLWRCRISSYRPYYYNGSLGWYIVANLINYFLYPDGRWVRLSVAPCYYAYHYDIAHRHRLNFRNWHFWKCHSRPVYSRPPRPVSRPRYSYDKGRVIHDYRPEGNRRERHDSYKSSGRYSSRNYSRSGYHTRSYEKRTSFSNRSSSGYRGDKKNITSGRR